MERESAFICIYKLLLAQAVHTTIPNFYGINLALLFCVSAVVDIIAIDRPISCEELACARR